MVPLLLACASCTATSARPGGDASFASDASTDVADAAISDVFCESPNPDATKYYCNAVAWDAPGCRGDPACTVFIDCIDAEPPINHPEGCYVSLSQSYGGPCLGPCLGDCRACICMIDSTGQSDAMLWSCGF